ncbi:MAG: thioredoxin domain-containing protein [Coleofasciculaceae cyanobacterium]
MPIQNQKKHYSGVEKIVEDKGERLNENCSLKSKKAGKLIALLLLSCLTLLSWSFPAQAVTRISPQLEEQVLEIIRNNPEVILDSVQAYQQRQREELQQRQQAFVQELKANPQLVIAQSPTTGSAKANLLLVEFSDFQCPYCAQAHETVKEFMTKHGEQVTLVYKHYPLTSIHPQALPAAKAAWAAAKQAKFWQYHDALFTQQEQLGEELYMTIAKKLNLDLEQFNRDRNGDTAEAAVQADMQLAEGLGISGTPFFVLNGETFSGAVKLSQMEKILERVSLE